MTATDLEVAARISVPATIAVPGSIDEPTYQAWFTNDLTVNITDRNSPALANVGRSALQFPP